MKVSILKKSLNKALQIVLPLFLGIIIFAWTYHDFDFNRVWKVVTGEMDYGWMLFSLVFGVMGHVFRGWRWCLSLEPLGEKTTNANSIYAVFVAYAVNLVIPRIGEASRCGVLKKYDGVSFSKSLGTVVMERIIDSGCIFLITVFTLVLQSHIFARFFKTTGTDVSVFSGLFTSTNFYISLLCIVSLFVLLYYLIKNLSMFTRVKVVLNNVWQGCVALKYMKHRTLFTFYTICIWVCYFFQFYVAFYCFDFSSHLGLMPGLVLFVVGSIAVAVPTPNGAGPWHFAVITMMMMYGVSKDDAGIFALLVHGIQTFLLILLGIYGWIALPIVNRNRKPSAEGIAGR